MHARGKHAAGLLIAAAMLMGAPARSAVASLVANGTFDDAKGWQAVVLHGQPAASFPWVAPDGAGNALRLNGPANSNVAVWQAVELVAGKRYTLDGFSRDLGSTAGSAWAEVFIGREKPASDRDYADNCLVNYNTFDGGCPKWNAPFSQACGKHDVEFVPGTSGTYYVVMKAGTMDKGPFDVMFDNITLTEASVSAATTGTTGGALRNGDFSQGAAGWTNWTQSGFVRAAFDSSNAPSGGAAPALEIQGRKIAGADFTNGGVWQSVQLSGGTEYELTGFARDVGSPAKAAWLEIWLGDASPRNGEDYKGTKLADFSTFADGCDNFDLPLAKNCGGTSTTFRVPGNGPVTMYLLVKAGITQVADGTTFSFLVDSLDLQPKGAVASIKTDSGVKWEKYDSAAVAREITARQFAIIYARRKDVLLCADFEKRSLLTEPWLKQLERRTVFFLEVDEDLERARELGVTKIPALVIVRANKPPVARAFEPGADAAELAEFLRLGAP